MGKRKLITSYRFQKYDLKIPHRLSFLTNKLYMEKTIFTYEERKKITRERNAILTTFNKKKCVLNEIHSKKVEGIFAYCMYREKLYNFLKKDNYRINGWINLYCIELEKNISCRYCDDNTLYIYASNLIGKHKNKIFLIRKL